MIDFIIKFFLFLFKGLDAEIKEEAANSKFDICLNSADGSTRDSITKGLVVPPGGSKSTPGTKRSRLVAAVSIPSYSDSPLIHTRSRILS